MPELSPEVKAQLEEQKKNCPFCKIIKGDIPATQVYKDKLMESILDINPCVKGHALLFPKEHYPIMAFLPPETFRHMFGLIPRLVDAVKKSMLCTGANVFIANGGVAGQQSPHFLIHLIPREKGDRVDKFGLGKKQQIDGEKAKQANLMLAKNLPMILQDYFSKNPAKWHTGKIKTAGFLEGIKAKGNAIYEDEKTLCAVPQNPQCPGHLVIYSNEEENLFENLSSESAAHMFSLASSCATAVFQGLKAHGSNIILKTGISDDNPEGKLCIHVLPRFQEDGIDVMWKPMNEKPDFKEIASRIKDQTFLIEHSMKKEKTVTIDLDARQNVMKIGGDAPGKEPKEEEPPRSGRDEIAQAIDRIIGE